MSRANPNFIVTNANKTLSRDNSGSVYTATSGGSDPVTLTLPPASLELEFEFENYDAKEIRVVVSNPLTEKIWLGGGTNGHTFFSYDVGAFLVLSAESSTVWTVKASRGRWWVLSSKPTTYVTGIGNSTQSSFKDRGILNEVLAFNLISDAAQAGAPPAAGRAGDCWVVNNWGGGYTDGDVLQWDGAVWNPIVTLSTRPGAVQPIPQEGARFIVAGVTGDVAGGSFTGKEGKIVESSGYEWAFIDRPRLGKTTVGSGDGTYGDKVYGSAASGTGWVEEAFPVDHDALTNVTKDQHHNENHNLNGKTHIGVAGAVENDVMSFDHNGLPKDSGVSVDAMASGWTEFSPTSLSGTTFTFTPTADLLNKIRPGVPIKWWFKKSNTYSYNIVKSVGLRPPPDDTQPLVTLMGQGIGFAAWPDDRVWFGTTEMVEHRVLSVPGNFNDADDTQLIQNDLSTFFRWDEEDAYLVGVDARCITADSGADPTLNVTIGGSDALDIAIAVNAGWNDIDNAGALSRAGRLVFNDLIELSVAKGGGNGDAQDLTVVLTFVKDRNVGGEFRPSADPLILMTISGLVGPATWCGLGNGTHILIPGPGDYSWSPLGTTAPLFQQESWQFRTVTTGTTQKLQFWARGQFSSPTTSKYTTYGKSWVKVQNGSLYTPFQYTHGTTVDGPHWGMIKNRLCGSVTIAGVTFTWEKFGTNWKSWL